ncbi:AAA family ATPase [Oceanihabitans sediminis]|uniref:ATPase n=1 Tax=Oceanihabitans sediminis TaxID=1812012 RepID=A0A368P147_9FLAO|nr:ATP-binding protein [Oceanihabitans sediminis]MDX1277892.1 ATP-binding protein [Oceanihabitans sediminis]MDX1774507.1 ATP-binding protein [Oceanihabitans sediminis]RBP27794.1 putative ATPase [Oceanihabitans sediminis]RCU56577.1 ATPase [Oceanihabitans sediminis]
MNTKKIVITGGPGTGKTSLIKELNKRGYHCCEEISRQVTLKAREDGIEQLFLTDPLLFSQLLLDGRKKQFNEAKKCTKDFIFLDRGIPDVLAYMDFIGDEYPQEFIDACQNNKYDHVFILAPWQEIFSPDSERYENFEQATEIHKHLINTYKNYNYELVDVPFSSIESRADFIVDIVKAL